MSTCKSRLAYNNLLEVSDQDIEVSSENVLFPKANLTHPDRTKCFRFAGSVLVTNATKMFYASTGSFALAVTRHTNADLAAAIDLALGSDWSFEYDTDSRKFRIKKATAGTILFATQTQAIWYSLGFTQVVDTAASTDWLYATEVRNHYPYERVSVDTGYDATARFFALIGDTFAPLKLSPSAIITLQGNDHGEFETLTSPTEVVLGYDERGIYSWFNEDELLTHRYWSVKIDDVRNPNDIEIGHLFIGDYLQMPLSRNFDTGFQVEENDNADLMQTDGGQVYAGRARSTRTFSALEAGNIKKEVVAFWKAIFKDVKTYKPFYFSLDPAVHVSTDLHELTAYARFANGPQYRHVVNNVYSLGVTITEVV